MIKMGYICIVMIQKMGFDSPTDYYGPNLLSWGVGNYNKFNMFGRDLSKSKMGTSKIHVNKEPGLFGIRIGQGRRFPVAFIDIGPEIVLNGKGYHLHFNFAKRNKRQGEKILDTVQ